MKNIEYFKNIMNSNLDGETKALALSALVNSKFDANTNICKCYTATSGRPRYFDDLYKIGVEAIRSDVKGSIMTIIIEAMSELGKCRCKDIAKYANDKYFEGNDVVKYTVVKAVTTLLANEGILERQYEEAVINVEDVEWVNGQRQWLRKDKVVEVTYFVFASKVELDV